MISFKLSLVVEKGHFYASPPLVTLNGTYFLEKIKSTLSFGRVFENSYRD